MKSKLAWAFAAAVLGGLDSPLGAVVGGLLLGVTITLIGRYVGFIGTTLQLPAALGLILALLLVLGGWHLDEGLVVVIEESVEVVILLLRKGIVLVVVALTAIDGQA